PSQARGACACQAPERSGRQPGLRAGRSLPGGSELDVVILRVLAGVRQCILRASARSEEAVFLRGTPMFFVVGGQAWSWPGQRRQEVPGW
ncbi:unnamed protein product, partial [Polarella glacialis]